MSVGWTQSTTRVDVNAVVWAGWGGATPIWAGDMAKNTPVKNISTGGHLYVFAG